MEQQTTNDEIICVSKRHWIVYILPGFLMFLGLCTLLGSLRKFDILGLIIALGLILFSIQRFFAYRNTSWVLTKDRLTIRSGFILGTVYYEMESRDIYECYCTRGILGSILRYGTLVVRRTDGVSTEFFAKYMNNVNEMMVAINSFVKNGEVNYSTSGQQSTFVADELQKLLELKNKGILTEEEFNVQKQKLINK